MGQVRPHGHLVGVKHAMEFCLHNNVVVAALAAQVAGAKKVLIIDWVMFNVSLASHITALEDISMRLSLHRHEGGQFYLGTGAAHEVAIEFVVETSWDCFGYFDLRLRLSIMGEPLSLDLVFDFLMDELEPQHAYDFFAPGPLPGYANNPNNMNGWIESHVPLLGELGEMGEPLGAEVDEPLVDPVIDELAEPIIEVEEQMVAPAMNMEEDLAMLFGLEDDSSDDDFEGPVHVPPSVIEDLCTRMGNLEYGHGLLVKKVITISDAKVMASQMVQVVNGLEQVGAHVEQGQQAATQRDETITGLSQCLADVKRRSPGPQ
ncbi:hypothetical protein Tco_0691240 [Tanacetum coccineum]